MDDLRQVLVIDDDTFLRMLVSVELPDVELIEASRLDEGYQKAVAERPDAILLDLRLPDGDGRQLLRRLRDAPMVSDTPILVITAGHDEAHRAELVEAGADEYLAKPVEGVELRARIDRLRSLGPDGRRRRREETLTRAAEGLSGEPGPPLPPAEPPPRPPKRRLLDRFRRD